MIEALLERLQPDTIYTHHGGDLNIDHQVVHRAVMTATRPMVGQPVKEIYAFEIPSSTEWSFGQFHPIFSPNVFVNIGDTMKTKIEAMKCYKTEIRPAPHPRSPEALQTIAARWGSVCGMNYAEAFVLIRSVRV
jgi:LmbE family N-acetylglucosaminyl deacetylase